jgi:hypothetical protein
MDNLCPCCLAAMAEAFKESARKNKPMPESASWYCPEHNFRVIELAN